MRLWLLTRSRRNLCKLWLLHCLCGLSPFDREQEEEHDKEIERLHQAAIQGELRRKKRHHGVGINDSDDDSDEDERNRHIRRQMNKRRKIDRANIKALGE